MAGQIPILLRTDDTHCIAALAKSCAMRFLYLQYNIHISYAHPHTSFSYSVPLMRNGVLTPSINTTFLAANMCASRAKFII